MENNNQTTLLKWMNEIVNVRDYNNLPIAEHILNDLYDAFTKGPASISTQARELYVINDQELIKKIVEATLDPYITKNSYGSQSWITNAPFVSAVLIEKRRAMARVGEKGLIIALQEAESAIQNFRLMARTHQLGTACVREFDQELLRKNLNLPWYIDIAAILVAGYSDKELTIPPRFSVDEVISKGEWE